MGNDVLGREFEASKGRQVAPAYGVSGRLGITHAVGEAGSNGLKMLEAQGVNVLGAAICRAAQQERVVNAATGQALFRRLPKDREILPVTE